MSATNRGSTPHADNYYVTPQPMIENFFMEFDQDTNIIGHINTDARKYVLDPCAGGDPYHEMSYPTVLERHLKSGKVRTMDIRKTSRAAIVGDFLKFNKMPTETGRDPVMIIANPPFNLAIEFIKHSLGEVEWGGYVVMLLRLNFFGSNKRQQFWQNNMPMYTYVHSQRPGFYPDMPSKTDSTEYAHFVWRSGERPKFTKLRVI